MTVKQAAFLTSRVISLWFFYGVITSMAQLPSAYFTMTASASLRDVPSWNGVSRSLAASTAAMIFHSIVQAIVELVLGTIFYRFGPRVARFLIGAEEEVVSDSLV